MTKVTALHQRGFGDLPESSGTKVVGSIFSGASQSSNEQHNQKNDRTIKLVRDKIFKRDENGFGSVLRQKQNSGSGQKNNVKWGSPKNSNTNKNIIANDQKKTEMPTKKQVATFYKPFQAPPELKVQPKPIMSPKLLPQVQVSKNNYRPNMNIGTAPSQINVNQYQNNVRPEKYYGSPRPVNSRPASPIGPSQSNPAMARPVSPPSSFSQAIRPVSSSNNHLGPVGMGPSTQNGTPELPVKDVTILSGKMKAVIETLADMYKQIGALTKYVTKSDERFRETDKLVKNTANKSYKMEKKMGEVDEEILELKRILLSVMELLNLERAGAHGGGTDAQDLQIFG